MGSTVSACLATSFGIKGINYSISSACSTSAHCIGAGMEQIQMDKQDEIHQLRRKNKLLFQEHFEKIPGVRSVGELPEAETSWFGVPIICDSKKIKNDLTKHLESNKIQTTN